MQTHLQDECPVRCALTTPVDYLAREYWRNFSDSIAMEQKSQIWERRHGQCTWIIMWCIQKAQRDDVFYHQDQYELFRFFR